MTQAAVYGVLWTLRVGNTEHHEQCHSCGKQVPVRLISPKQKDLRLTRKNTKHLCSCLNDAHCMLDNWGCRHTLRICNVLFHGNSGYANAPPCYVIHTVPVLWYCWTLFYGFSRISEQCPLLGTLSSWPVHQHTATYFRTELRRLLKSPLLTLISHHHACYMTIPPSTLWFDFKFISYFRCNW